MPVYPTPTFVRSMILTGFQIGSFLLTLLSFNLLVVVGIGSHLAHKANPFSKDPPRAKCSKEWEQRISGERYSNRAEYYANYWGYECEDIDVETEDGFILRLHHLTSKKHKAGASSTCLRTRSLRKLTCAFTSWTPGHSSARHFE